MQTYGSNELIMEILKSEIHRKSNQYFDLQNWKGPVSNEQ